MIWREWAQQDRTALAERVRLGEMTPAELAAHPAAGKGTSAYASISYQPIVALNIPENMMRGSDPDGPAFIFDLDGTLVDSVYQHVLAWREALHAADIDLSVWRIHRRVGMSGGLFAHALLRETGRPVTDADAAALQRAHAEAYARLVDQVRPMPGSRELLSTLTAGHIPWAIAPSGRVDSARPTLDLLGVGPDHTVITRDQVRHAEPEPDLFLAAAERLGVPISAAVVVGDSVWDLLAAQRSGPGGGVALGWLRAGGTGAGGRVPGLRRSGRPPPPPR